MTARLTEKQRRDQLIEVAIEHLSCKGINGTTTREIVSTTGVTEAIIQGHFATKERLAGAIIEPQAQFPLLRRLASPTPHLRGSQR